MRILHINSNYLHTPLYSEMLIRLENHNIENTIIMPRKKNDNKHLSNDILLHRGKVIEQQILGRLDRFLYFNKQKKIERWIEKSAVRFTDYDIVHAHTLFSDGYIAYKTGKPYVVTVRNTDLNYYFKYYRHLYKIGEKILENACAVIFLSESYKNKVIKKVKSKNIRRLLSNKAVVIPNGINDFWIEHQNHSSKTLNEPINILFVGRIMKNKNIEFLIKNLKQLSREMELQLHIVGEVVDQKYFDKIKKSPLIFYHGKLQKTALKLLMNEMHIFAMVSHKETFGLVYLEALTQSLPLLYTSDEGFDKYYKDGYVGYPVHPKKDWEFKSNLKKILKNYEKIQRNISSIDKNDFGWNNNAEKHLEIYKSLERYIF